MVAALFAVHPLNVESVAWIAERKNVLCMLFFLLALAAYGWYVRRPTVARYLAVALLFAMGLMSKPMVITLPLVLLLLDYWPLGRMRFSDEVESRDEASPRFAASAQPVSRLCLEKVPLLALSAGSAIITMIAQRAGGAVLTSAEHSPLLRLENVIVCYGLYIKKAFWPSHLAALYPYPHTLPAVAGRCLRALSRCRHLRRPEISRASLPRGGLVLVSGDDGSHDWLDTSWQPGHGRSLRLSAIDRPFHHDRLGCCRLR